MHEDILAARTAQKAESLRVVKPLHRSLFHCNLFLLDRCTAELNVELIASKAGKRNKQEIQIGFFDLSQCTPQTATNIGNEGIYSSIS